MGDKWTLLIIRDLAAGPRRFVALQRVLPGISTEQLRSRLNRLVADGLVHGDSGFPASLSVIIAVLLLLVGVLAVTSIAFKLGPFQLTDASANPTSLAPCRAAGARLYRRDSQRHISSPLSVAASELGTSSRRRS